MLKFTNFEIEVMKRIYSKNHRWMVRSYYGQLIAFTHRPERLFESWAMRFLNIHGASGDMSHFIEDDFQFVQWEDIEPFEIKPEYWEGKND